MISQIRGCALITAILPENSGGFLVRSADGVAGFIENVAAKLS